MNERDLDSFEADLQRLRPTTPPEPFRARLHALHAQLQPTALRQPDPLPPTRPGFAQIVFSRIGAPWRLPGWFAATAASALLLGSLGWLAFGPSSPLSARRPGRSAGPILKADKVEIGQDLVATFDAVARLPNGEPVRFRCQEWSDQMVFRASSQGVEIEQRTPRLEIVPVRFETY